jgi:hypothetical protein
VRAFVTRRLANPDGGKNYRVEVTAHFRVRYDKIGTNGTATLRYGSRLLHLGMVESTPAKS